MRVSTKKYLFVAVILLILPFLISLRLVIFGEKTIGKVIYHKEVHNRRSKAGGYYTYAVIKFTTSESKEFELLGPSNAIYPVGTELKIYYNKKNPTDNLLFNFSGIYLSTNVFIPGILFIIWSAIFFAMRESNNGKLKKNRKIEVFEENR